MREPVHIPRGIRSALRATRARWRARERGEPYTYSGQKVSRYGLVSDDPVAIALKKKRPNCDHPEALARWGIAALLAEDFDTATSAIREVWKHASQHPVVQQATFAYAVLQRDSELTLEVLDVLPVEDRSKYLKRIFESYWEVPDDVLTACLNIAADEFVEFTS